MAKLGKEYESTQREMDVVDYNPCMDSISQILIIRGADFGANFAPKFWLCILTLALIGRDIQKEKRFDYLWVFLTGTAIWTSVEIALQATGARVMPLRDLYGLALPTPVSALIQGMAEGAFVAVFSLYVGDRLRRAATRKEALMWLVTAGVVLLIQALLHRSADGVDLLHPSSRRNILAPRALIFLACMVFFNLIFLWRYGAWRKRVMFMVTVMLAVTTLWTLQQVWIGERWVEIAYATGVSQPASPLITLLALAFDLIVEMASAYVPFFSLPVMLGLITKRDAASL